MKRLLINSILYTIIALMVSSCSGTRHLPPGEKLYVGSKVKIEATEKIHNKGKITEAAKSVIRPDPNASFLGIRTKLWLYSIAGNPTKKGVRSWLKSQGEPPVLMSTVKPAQTTQYIDAALFNIGIFNGTADYKIIEKKHTVRVIYTCHVSNPYTIKDVSFNLGNTAFTKLITDAQKETLIKPGSDYDLGALKNERERIDGVLKDNGYFYFSPDYLLFKVDTSQATKTVSLQLTIKEETPDKAVMVYKIDHVYINPDFSLNDGKDTLKKARERMVVDSVIFLDKHTKIKPKVILESVYLKRNDTYSRKNHNITLNRLMNLGVYKFVRVKFNPGKTDSSKLDMIILLTPMPKRTLRAEGNLISKSNDFVGPEANVSYRNRNTFHGAELLNLNLAGSFETQFSGQYKNLYSYSVNPQVELYFPRFIVPFRIKKTSSLYVPKTKFSIGYNYLKRIGYFDMRTFQFIYGYKWKESITKEHELDPVNVNFTSVVNRSPEFNALLASNPFIKKSYEEQFIAGVTYSYRYNEQVLPLKINQFYFNLITEAAGNTFSALNSIGGKKVSSDQPFSIGGTPYSQFAKISVDIRDYYNFKNSKMVFRLFGGVGKAYGNSSTLPYVKQFFSGGPNSIRAFPINSLGPGSFLQPRTSDAIFIQQGGDIKLESNAEYRFDIFKFLKGAAFVDAGNIWLLKNDPAVTSPPFAFDRFYKEIAVGAGVGLRVDVSFFVLRFDLGVPLRKPWLPESERWVINKISLGDPNWRSDNLILNVAIGYPF